MFLIEMMTQELINSHNDLCQIWFNKSTHETMILPHYFEEGNAMLENALLEFDIEMKKRGWRLRSVWPLANLLKNYKVKHPTTHDQEIGIYG